MDEKDKETAEKFKRPLDLDQMIEYLRNTKRVTFININEDQAKEILYAHNYINVITPFKHHFAKKNKNLETEKVNGCHVYERDVDFSEYYQLYCDERKDYPTIFKNIMAFEHLLNSIVSYEVLNSYNLCCLTKYYEFTDSLERNIDRAYKNQKINEFRKKAMLDTVNELKQNITLYHSPYIVLDNLSMNDSLNILISLDKKKRNRCFREIMARLKNGNIIRNGNPLQVHQQVSRIIKIRNCICHNDSLEILIRYYSRKRKDLRKEGDRNNYIKLIKTFKIL